MHELFAWTRTVFAVIIRHLIVFLILNPKSFQNVSVYSKIEIWWLLGLPPTSSPPQLSPVHFTIYTDSRLLWKEMIYIILFRLLFFVAGRAPDFPRTNPVENFCQPTQTPKTILRMYEVTKNQTTLCFATGW